MAKPNYAFEKRQRDLAKKKKKEEKLVERKMRKTAGGSLVEGEGPEGGVASPESEAAPAGTAPEGDVTDPGDGSTGAAQLARAQPEGGSGR